MPDLVVRWSDGVEAHGFSVLLGNGDGTFQAPDDLPELNGVIPRQLVDLDYVPEKPRFRPGWP